MREANIIRICGYHGKAPLLSAGQNRRFAMWNSAQKYGGRELDKLEFLYSLFFSIVYDCKPFLQPFFS